jgi:hypothetical protein
MYGLMIGISALMILLAMKIDKKKTNKVGPYY